MEDKIKLLAQKAILPILASTTEGELNPIGSGFIICTLGRQAIMLSAAHNFKEILRIDSPRNLYHPTTPKEFRPPKPKDKQLKRTRMYTIYRESDTNGYLTEIRNVYINNPADIAVCVVTFEDDIPSEVIFEKRIIINTTPPKKSSHIAVAGYAKMEVDIHEPTHLSNYRKAIYKQTLEWRHGLICNVFPSRGPTNQPWPCFQVDIAFDSGMSGGPVIDKSYGDLIVACGVISSDLRIDGLNMHVGSGKAAIASMLWTAMGIEIGNALIDGKVTKVKLIELVRRNYISDKGNAHKHIKFIAGKNTENYRMIWN